MKGPEICWLGMLLVLGSVHAEVPVLRADRILCPVLIAPTAAREERAAATDLAHVLGVMAGRDWPVLPERWWRKRGIHVGRSGPGRRLQPGQMRITHPTHPIRRSQ